MKKILVTGASGLLGSHVVRQLFLHPEYIPIPMVRTLQQAEEWKKLGVEAVVGDLRNQELDIPKDIWGVIHTAALAGDWMDRKDAFAVNVHGVEHLIKAVVHTQCKKFVHISTIGVYGHSPYKNATEDRKYQKSSVYENSKIEGEKRVLHAVQQYPNIKFVILRPPSMYGEGDRHIIPKFRKYLQQGKFLFISKGKSLYPIIHAADAARASILALDKPNIPSGAKYHICDDSEITLREFVEILAKHMGIELKAKSIPYMLAYPIGAVMEIYGKVRNKEPLIFRKRVKYLGRDRHIDISKARTELGFKPEITPDKGIPLTLKWLKEEEEVKEQNQQVQFYTIPFHVQKIIRQQISLSI